MNANTRRSTFFGALLLLAASALAGCATTGGATATGAATSRAAHALTLEVGMPAGAVICSGAHASRFPQQEELGRVCNHSPVLQAIY